MGSPNNHEPGTGTIFDVDSFNFHMIPKDENLSQAISDLLKLRRDSLVQFWDYHDLYSAISGLTLIPSVGKVGNIYNISKLTNDKYTAANCHLFHCLLFQKGDKYYYINLMRFFCDVKNKLVNCVLACLQFDCCYNTYYINKGLKGKAEICFPTDDKSSVSVNKNIKNNLNPNSRKNFSFNPDIAFDSEPKEIIKAFLRFVQEVEESEENKD